MSLLNLQDLLPGNSKDPIGKNLFDFVDDRKEDLSNLVGSGFKAVDSFIDQNIPGGEQFTDNWSTGINEINEKISGATEALKRRSQEPIDSIDDIGPWALGSFIKGSEDTTEAARTVAEAAGIDPRAGDIVGGLATEAALFGVGKLTKGVSKLPPPKTPKFALATQSSRPGLLQLSPQGPHLSDPVSFDQIFRISVDEAPRGFAREKRARGRNPVIQSLDRSVESHMHEGLPTNKLTHRKKNTALATNYDISDQDMFQGRYGKPGNVASQAHHALDQELFGRAFEGPEGADVRLIANKNMFRFGNDAFNMADVPGYITGSDHQSYFHGKIYRQLPARQELKSAIEDGSYYRYSPKYRAKLVISAAKESQQSVIRWAKWKLNLMEDKYPTMKQMNSKQKRHFVEQLKEEFQSIGAGQQPSMEELMKGKPQYLNDDLREVFGIQFGSRPSTKSHSIPSKHRRRPDGSIGTY